MAGVSWRVRMGRVVALLIVVYLAGVSSGGAQSARSGEIHGRVLDQSGGAVAGARVLVSVEAVVPVVTDANGVFTLRDVAPGRYRLRVELSPFEPGVLDVEVPAAGSTAPLTVVLRVAGLEEAVTVTATREASSVWDAPASVTVVSRSDLEQRNISRIGDALKGVAGIHMRGNTFGDLIPGSGNQSFAMRGLPRASRNLMLIDGNPVNTVRTGGVNFGVMDMDNAERVEVVRGAFSSLYGGNALGGVINLITPIPKRREVGFRIGLGAGAIPQNQQAINYSDRFGKLALSVGYSRVDNDSYIGDYVVKSPVAGTPGAAVTGATATTTAQGAAGYLVGHKGKRPFGQTDVRAKLFYDFTPRTTAWVGYAYNRYDSGYSAFESYLRDASGAPVYSGTVGIDGRRITLTEPDFLTATPSFERTDRVFARLKHDFVTGGSVQVDANRIATHFEFTNAQSTGRLDDGPGENNIQPATRQDVTVQLTRPLLGNRHTVVAGTQATWGNGGSNRVGTSNWRDTTTETNQRYASFGTSQLFAFFLQDEILLTSRLRVFVGGRYDFWRTEGRVDQFIAPVYSEAYPRRTDSQFSPKVSAVFRPYSTTAIRASVGRSFRAPTISELFNTSIGLVGTVTSFVEADPNLRPEYVTAWEVGVDQRLWQGPVLRATVFNSDLRNMVYRKTIVVNVLSQQANAGQARARGIELELSQPVTGHLEVFATAAFNDSKITANDANPALVGKWVPEVPARLMSVGLDGRVGRVFGSAILRDVGRYFGASDDTNSGIARNVPGAYDAYQALDLSIGYKLSARLSVTAGINNATNRQYYQIYKMPGTTVLLQLRGTL